MRKIVFLSVVILGALVMAVAFAEDDGKSLYESKCAMCHGKDGVAKKMGKGSADLSDPEWQKNATLEEIITITEEGKGKMPKYKNKLTAEQIKLIAEYIKTLKYPAAQPSP